MYVVGEDIALVWRAGGKGQWAGVNKDRIVSKMPTKFYLKSITGTVYKFQSNGIAWGVKVSEVLAKVHM